MRSDFAAAISAISAERGVPKEIIIESVEAALVSAYKRNFNATGNVSVRIDPGTGQANVFLEKEVVEDITDPTIEISLEDARRINPRAQIGEVVEIDNTPQSFGRIAAQTAKQVVLQRIREAERDHIYEEYIDREGDIITGVVQRFEPRAMILELGKAEALLPQSEQVPSERYRLGQRLKGLLLEVQKNHRGPQLIVSRTHKNLLRRLFELEVPEIYSGTVEIKSIAREPGLRSKVAVAARQEGVDPVGSCVGMRGVRIQNIVNELYGEKIDVVQWSPETSVFIANALSPAQVLSVDLSEEEKTANVVVPERQLSLAIGKEGQNARLAAKLTGWRIDIKSSTSILREQEDEFARRAAEAFRQGMAEGAGGADESGAESAEEAAPPANSREVRKDATVTYAGRIYGPLPPYLVGERVQIEPHGEKFLVLWGDELVTSFDVAEGIEDEEAEEAVDTRKVRKDRSVTWKNVVYKPLPEELVGQTVELRVTAERVRVFADGRQVAEFERQP